MSSWTGLKDGNELSLEEQRCWNRDNYMSSWTGLKDGNELSLEEQQCWNRDNYDVSAVRSSFAIWLSSPSKS